MMKNALVKAIALIACLALLAACGAAPETPAPEQESPQTSQAPAAEAPPQEDEQVPTDPPLPEPDLDSVDVGGTMFNVDYIDSGLAYPLTDEPVTLTYYTSTMDNLLLHIETYNDHKMLPYIEEQTGIHLEFVGVSGSAYSEQFNLVVAGGELYDYMDFSSYSGGMAKAYTDELIYDLTGYMDQWGPNFLHAAQSAGTTLKDITTDDGLMLYMCTINDLYQPISGISVRMDWFEEQELEPPSTIDQLYEALKVMKAAYDCPATLNLDPDGVMYDIYGAFGINAVAFASSMMPQSAGSEIGAFFVDGVVYSSLLMDEYKDYLTFENQLYAEGLVDQDFYSNTVTPNSMAPMLAAGHSAVFRSNADEYSTVEDLGVEQGVRLEGIAPIVMNEGDTYMFGEKPTYVGMHKTCVTTACENPELAVGYMNWFFTREGSISGSYGTLDESYVLDENGDPMLTNLVLANPDGMGTNVASMYYTFGLTPTYLIRERLWPGYLQKELDALSLWTQTATAEYTIPSISMTTDEANRYSTLASDIFTYSSETLLKFVVGEEELNDQSWQEFTQSISDMGVEECVSILQGALDRYLDR